MDTCPYCQQKILLIEPAGVMIKGSKSIFVQKIYCNNPQCSHYCGLNITGDPIQYVEVAQQLVSDTILQKIEKARVKNEVTTNGNI